MDENAKLRAGTLPADHDDGCGPPIKSRPADDAAGEPHESADPGWDPPVSFDDGEVPPFPVSALSPWLGAFVEAEAKALQVPSDLPALLGLAVIALALAKKVSVEVKPGWVEPANIYTVIALPPSDRKSPAFRDIMQPVFCFEKAEIERLAPMVAAASAKVALADARIGALRGRFGRAKEGESDEIQREYDEEVAMRQSLPVLAEPRFVLDDATPEAIGVCLHAQGGRIGVFSSEGGPLEIMAGRYSDMPNIDLFLKAYSGDPCSVDRIGRAGFKVYAPALTLGLTVQPSVIAGLAGAPGFRGRGLLARFLYSMPRSMVGYRAIDPPPVPESVRVAYVHAVDRLLRLPGRQDDHGELTARVVTLDPEARAMLLATGATLEPRLGPGGDLAAIGDWAGKLVGAIARIALLLHVADRGHAPETALGVPIDGQTMVRAVTIGEYLVCHAIAAFGTMGADPVIANAKHALAWIQRHQQPRFSRREIHRGVQSRMAKVEELGKALAILEQRGHIRLAPSERAAGGRPTGPSYDVNPAVLNEGTPAGKPIA